MGSGGSKKSSAKASEQVAEKTPVQVEGKNAGALLGFRV